ncbi:hypothetical protein TB1_005163 [Malus domestica]
MHLGFEVLTTGGGTTFFTSDKDGGIVHLPEILTDGHDLYLEVHSLDLYENKTLQLMALITVGKDVNWRCLKHPNQNLLKQGKLVVDQAEFCSCRYSEGGVCIFWEGFYQLFYLWGNRLAVADTAEGALNVFCC